MLSVQLFFFSFFDSLVLLQLSLDADFQLLLIVQPLTQMLMLGSQTKHDRAEGTGSAAPGHETEHRSRLHSCVGHRPPVWIHLLSASFCCSISSSRSFRCSVTLWIFWWHRLSSSLKKKVLDWKNKKTPHISSYYNSTFMTLLILPVWSVSGRLWAHLHTNTSDALIITGLYLLMVHNTPCHSMETSVWPGKAKVHLNPGWFGFFYLSTVFLSRKHYSSILT